jgi:hypothetical protein
MKTSTDREPLYVKYGSGIRHRRSTIKTKYLLNFQNRKNTKIICFAFQILLQGESYIGGKYIDLTMQKGILSISINRILL